MTDLRNFRKELQMTPVQSGAANPRRKIIMRIPSFMNAETCVAELIFRERRSDDFSFR
jgi:hypothetical protein